VAVRGAASNGWLPVTCGGQAGFISTTYARVSTGTPATPTVTPTSSATATATAGTPTNGQTAYITGTGGSGLRCRTAPISGAVITVLPENTRVTIETQSSGWARIQCGGQTGWVSMTYILFTASPGTGDGALRIDVNLRTQYMIVYQGTNVLGRSYVSTGRPGFDTPTGTYYINRKVLIKDMSGVLGGEYYHVRDVPHVMYFTYRGHAIHGAYWHNNFGYVMSHGCVNLPTGFAAWLYSITPIGTKMTITSRARTQFHVNR
jgi:lipoprotein-anchoring transpeptidase ErfK/SrfK